jgi:uncharacterized repeat protein (TIGR01451 family)
MKKLLPLFLFIAFANAAMAQTATFSIITPACHNDGMITAGFTGVTAPLTVTWTTYGTSGTSIVHTGVSGLSDILTGYSGGPLSIDAVGPDSVHAVGFYSGAPPFTYTDASTSAMCPALGRDTIIVAGGTAPYTYSWFNKATMGFVGTGSALNLPSGSYGVTITDAAGCVFGSLVNADFLSVFTSAPFHDSMSVTPANCTNGTATGTPVGSGLAPYSYLWSNGATTPTISGLVTGAYSVRITDANGCSDSAAVFVPQTMVISAPVVPTPATCVANNGALSAFGSGGTPPYTYLWSNGATTQSQVSLPSGFYSLHITDANGCVGFGAGFVGASTPITVSYTTSPSLCTAPTGTATLALSGGTGVYTVQWITSPVQTSLTATGLTYGTYAFHVTDGVGCVQSGTVYVPPIDIISVSFSAVPALCTLSNGSLMAMPVGGVAPYHYLWSTGATTAAITSQPGGVYNLTITDNLGCQVAKTPYLPINSPVGVGVVTTPASCIFTSDGTDSAIVWGGTPPYTYAWSNGGTTRTVTSLPTGPYWLTVSDVAGCISSGHYSFIDYNPAGTSCYCTIGGLVFADYNGNCVQDGGEPGIPNIQIQISGRGYTYTDATGHYAMKVPAGSYTVSETVLAFYPLAVCQTNNISVTVAGGGCTVTQDFANAIDSIHDMHISTWDYYNAAVVGHAYVQATIVTNEGTMNEDSVLIGYHPDGQLFAPTIVPGGIFSGTPYWYTTPAPAFFTLAPGANQQFLMTYSVPTNIPIGTNVVFKDSVSFKGDMLNWLTDYSPWNNVNYFTTTTSASFDPNFKEVSPKGTGATGIISYTDSVLEYMVHFQNTGTSMAENITVIDTLDDNLNWSTLRPVYQSAKCQVTLTQVGSKKIAKFVFNNINLPAMANEPLASNGMFTYTVHLQPSLPAGSQIRNHASIYFDYNEPVVTNSTINTIGTANPIFVGVKSIAGPKTTFAIYPNPANNVCNAVINAITSGSATIEVADITGKVISSKVTSLQKGAQTIQVDISSLTPGAYVVSFIQNGSTQSEKLVIIK